jgi:hypothetical protein
VIKECQLHGSEHKGVMVNRQSVMLEA